LIFLGLRIRKPGKAPPQLSKLELITVGRVPQFTVLPSILRRPADTSFASRHCCKYSSMVGPPEPCGKVCSWANEGFGFRTKPPKIKTLRNAPQNRIDTSFMSFSLRVEAASRNPTGSHGFPHIVRVMVGIFVDKGLLCHRGSPAPIFPRTKDT